MLFQDFRVFQVVDLEISHFLITKISADEKSRHLRKKEKILDFIFRFKWNFLVNGLKQILEFVQIAVIFSTPEARPSWLFRAILS